jgi:hypothetical protein
MARQIKKTASYAVMHLTVAITVAYILSGDWPIALGIGRWYRRLPIPFMSGSGHPKQGQKIRLRSQRARRATPERAHESLCERMRTQDALGRVLQIHIDDNADNAAISQKQRINGCQYHRADYAKGHYQKQRDAADDKADNKD